jgi:hypothetical protein
LPTDSQTDRKDLDQKLASVDGEAILQRISVLVAGDGTGQDQALYDAAYNYEREAREVSPQTRAFVLGLFFGVEAAKALDT